MPAKFKKTISILLSIIAIYCFSACGSDVVQSNLTGTPEEILTKLNGDIAAKAEMPATLPPVTVTAETAQNAIGLSPEDFEKYVSSAASSMAAIGTFAHQIIVIEVKEGESASDVKTLVSGEEGYNPDKWICVVPEKAVAVESGNYVLIVAASGEVCDAAVAAFQKAAGAIGEVNTFSENLG